MIRLAHTLRLLTEGLPSVKASLQSPKRAIAFSTPDMLPRDQKAISDGHSISLGSRPQLRAGLILSNSSALLSRYPSEERVLNFFPSNDYQQFISIQRRRLSSTPLTLESSVDSKITGLSRLISDPGKRRKFLFGVKLLVGFGLFVLLGKFISEEERIELSLGPRPEDSEKIQEIKKFVVAFNQEKKKGITRKEFLPFQDQAFAFIDELRYIGGLAARCPFNTDLVLAKRGFLELSTCEDPKVQREALRYLNILLKKPLDPTQPAAELLWLEEDLGNMLRNTSEVKNSIPVMQELATAYSLVLEKIFLFCLDAGAQISNDQKLRLRKRANQISKKLENKPAFAYQAKNAEVIAKYILTPSQPVIETIKAMFGFIQPVSHAIESLNELFRARDELIEIFKRDGLDITLLLSQLLSYERWDKLKDFILEKSPELYKECEEPLRRVQNSWVNLEKDIPFHETIFLLRPCYMLTGSDQEVNEAIAESVKIVRQSQEGDWISFYRLVEMLAETALSSRSYDVRKTAFDEIVASMTPSTPRQVLYKIAITLFSLKSDPLFEKSAEDVLAKQRVLLQSTPELGRGLKWFQDLKLQIGEIDEAILSRYSFQPDPHSVLGKKFKPWVFQAKSFIPRKNILEDLVSTFQKYRYKTNQQVICGQGGVGKTTLATSYVKEFGRDYTFVYWIDAHNFENDWDNLAVKCRIDSDLEPDQKRIRLREYLEENEGWLLVIDQVENKHENTCKRLIPRKGGHVLMTARRLDNIAWAEVRQVNVRCFSHLEASHYLLQSKEKVNSDDHDHAKDIVTRLGCLPLALAQTRAHLENNPGISLKGFLDLYDQERTRIFGSSGAKIGKGVNESVHTTWAMNFKQLQEERLEIAELFSFLSFLNSEEIPSCLIDKWKDRNAQEWGQLEIKTATEILVKHVLLDVKKEEVYAIHPIIRQVSIDGLDEKQKIIFLYQAVSILEDLLINMFNSDQADKIEAFEVLRPHCEAIIEHITLNVNGISFVPLDEMFYLIMVIGMYHAYISEDRILAIEYFLFYTHTMFQPYLEMLKKRQCSHEVGVTIDLYVYLCYKFVFDLTLPEKIINKSLLKFELLNEIFDRFKYSKIEIAKETAGVLSLVGAAAMGGGIFSPITILYTLWAIRESAALARKVFPNYYYNVDKKVKLTKNLISAARAMIKQSDFQIAVNRVELSNLEAQQEQILLEEYSRLLSQVEGKFEGVNGQKFSFDKICSLYRYGNYFRFKNDCQTARNTFEKALELSEAAPNSSVELKQIRWKIYRELAWVCAELGDVSAAIVHQKKSYGIIRYLHDTDTHSDLRRSLVALKKYQKMQQNP